MSKISSFVIHTRSFFEYSSLKQVFKVLLGIISPNQVGSEPRIRYNCLISLGYKTWTYPYLVRCPRIGSLIIEVPDLCEKECSQVIIWGLAFTTVLFSLPYSHLWSNVWEIYKDKSRSDCHCLWLKLPWYHEYIELLAKDL